jgi:ankyrin repeat protein
MKHICIFFLFGILTIDPSSSQSPYREYNKFVKCIDQNDQEKAQLLIDEGYNVNSRNADGKTPFLYCLQQNKVNFARFFIDAGANIYLSDNRGNTCLHYAIENCTPDSIVYTLIQKGANINAVNNEGYTPLHFSILFSCDKLPFFLIEKGADYYLVTDLNENALHLSIESGCDTISHFLLNHNIDIRQPDNRGNTPLLAAMDFQRHDLAIQLIKMGADIHDLNNDNFDALFFAVVNEDTAIVKLLLEKGAEIEREEYPEVLIYVAARQENTKTVELLLLHGAKNPKICEIPDQCYNTAYICSVNARIAADSLKLDNFQNSRNFYVVAKAKYQDDLNEIRLKNTGKFVADVFLTTASALAGSGYGPYFDYEEDLINYLKTQIKKCEDQIEKLDKIIECFNSSATENKETCYEQEAEANPQTEAQAETESEVQDTITIESE